MPLTPSPPAYAVYARENDDNYGRPLTPFLGKIHQILAKTLRGWLPQRGKAQMACNYCFPTRTMF